MGYFKSNKLFLSIFLLKSSIVLTFLSVSDTFKTNNIDQMNWNTNFQAVHLFQYENYIEI